MLEDNNVCAICGAELHLRVGLIPAYVCPNCFHEFREEIINGAGWTRFLVNQEKQRRKRRNTLLAAGFVITPLSFHDNAAIGGANG